jgi:hypothetical protein
MASLWLDVCRPIRSLRTARVQTRPGRWLVVPTTRCLSTNQKPPYYTCPDMPRPMTSLWLETSDRRRCATMYRVFSLMTSGGKIWYHIRIRGTRFSLNQSYFILFYVFFGSRRFAHAQWVFSLSDPRGSNLISYSDSGNPIQSKSVIFVFIYFSVRDGSHMRSEYFHFLTSGGQIWFNIRIRIFFH